MIAKPKTAYFRAPPETIKVIPSNLPAELFIECEVEAPPSMRGRTVDLRIPAEQIPALLKAVRNTAIKARSNPMGGTLENPAALLGTGEDGSNA
jgi:hypothetical protein